jgi:hypothetical protein
MLPAMYCGPSQGPKTWTNCGLMLWILPGLWSQRASSIGRYTSGGLQVQHFKRMLGGWYEHHQYLLTYSNPAEPGTISAWHRCSAKDRFLRCQHTKERVHCCRPSSRRVSLVVALSFNGYSRTYRHEEYRQYLIDHILNVTLKHWDPSMRAIGAQSLCLICKFNLATLGSEASSRTV